MNMRKSCANKSSDSFLVYISIEYVTHSVLDTITRPYNEWPCNDYNANKQPYFSLKYSRYKSTMEGNYLLPYF